MTDRRRFLRNAAALGLLGPAPLIWAREEAGVVVNDIHSQLNATRVARVETPTSVDAARRLVARAAREGRPLCIAGGRHALGGQQFAAGAILVDTRSMDH
ncbi:MAG: hypothetical protein ACREUQ_03210, partial [Burkholderiales bacterium]